MKRGVLELTIDEFAALIQKVDIARYKDTPLGAKIYSAYEMAQPDQPVKLQVSEQELEMILDDAGIPEQNDPEALQLMRKKINEMLVKFRDII